MLQGEDLRQKEEQTDGQDDIRSILTHVNPEWREQRSTCARVLDPKNQNRMTRRRAGVVHTNWDNLMIKWSGCQRWWEISNDWKSLVKTAEELCKRILRKDEDKNVRGFSLTGREDVRSKIEEERKYGGKGEAEDLGSRLEQPDEDSDLARLKPDCELDEWKNGRSTIKSSERRCKRRRS